ncbi:hypothetical protein LA080_014100 [Diaporthe eres]|nr:hypothetical protein LA080_014100 [Diaporthe eres]
MFHHTQRYDFMAQQPPAFLFWSSCVAQLPVVTSQASFYFQHPSRTERPRWSFFSTPESDPSHIRRSGECVEDTSQNYDTKSLSLWRPVYLTKRALTAFFVTFTALAIGTQAMLLLSKRNNGLSGVNDGLHRVLWTYGPTALLTLVASFWTCLECQTKTIAPWIKMTGEVVRPDVPLTLRSEFVNSPSGLTGNGSLAYANFASMMRFGTPLPHGTSPRYAYKLVESDFLDTPSTVSTTLDGLIGDLECEIAALPDSSTLPDFRWGSSFPIRSNSCSFDIFPPITSTTHKFCSHIVGLQSGDCGGSDDIDDQRVAIIIVVLAGSRDSNVTISSSNSFICKPIYEIQRLDFSARGLDRIVSPKQQADSRVLSNVHPWDIMLSHLYHVPYNPMNTDNSANISNQTVYFDNYNFLAYLLANVSGKPPPPPALSTIFEDQEGAKMIFSNYYQQYTAFLAHTSLMQQVSTPSEGTVTEVVNRFLVRDIIANPTTGILGFCLITVGLISIFDESTKPVLPRSPHSVIGLAACLSSSPLLLGKIQGMGFTPFPTLRGYLDGWLYRIRPANAKGNASICTQERLVSNDELHCREPKNSLFRPASLSFAARLAVALTLVAITATLEATLRISKRKHGLGNVTSETGLFSGVYIATTVTTPLHVTDFVWYETTAAYGDDAPSSSLDVATLILDGNLTYPSFTYEDLILPNITVDQDFLTRHPNSSNIEFSSHGGISVHMEPEKPFENGESGLAGPWNLRVSPWLFGLGESPLPPHAYFGLGAERDAIDAQGYSQRLWAWGQWSADVENEPVDLSTTLFGPDLAIDPKRSPIANETSTSTVVVGKLDEGYTGFYQYIRGLSTGMTDRLFDTFFTLLTMSRYAVPIEMIGNESQASAVADAVQFHHRVLLTQLTAGNRRRMGYPNDTDMRERGFEIVPGTNKTSSYDATASIPSSRYRVVQDELSTRFLQGLLVAAFICYLANWYSIHSAGGCQMIPRQPTTTANVAALLADGNIIDLLSSENTDLSSSKETRKGYGRLEDCTFRLGWRELDGPLEQVYSIYVSPTK